MRGWTYLPIIAFVLLAALLWIGLGLNPRELPSALLNRPAPDFATPALFDDNPISKERLSGRPWVLNVWASWCAGCRVEHAALMDFSSHTEVPLVGLNYKDETDAAKQWLAELGNPYQLIAVDQSGDVGIDYGVYGVPETFLIDAEGVIRWKHTGPVNHAILNHELLPKLNTLLNARTSGS